MHVERACEIVWLLLYAHAEHSQILWSMHVTTAWPRPSSEGPRVYGVPHSSIACAYFFLEILSLAFPDWPVDITEFIPPPEVTGSPLAHLLYLISLEVIL